MPEQNEETESLDPETLAALDEGIKAAENGRRWTLQQALEFARNRREAWKTIPDDLTA
jgi:hypothetical protein